MARVKAVEESVRHNAGAITGTVEQGVDKITVTLVDWPDRDELTRVLNRTQRESETRIRHPKPAGATQPPPRRRNLGRRAAHRSPRVASRMEATLC